MQRHAVAMPRQLVRSLVQSYRHAMSSQSLPDREATDPGTDDVYMLIICHSPEEILGELGGK